MSALKMLTVLRDEEKGKYRYGRYKRFSLVGDDNVNDDDNNNGGNENAYVGYAKRDVND